MTSELPYTFSDGDTLLAAQVNADLEYCLSDTSTRIGALQTSVQSSISSINGDISGLETQLANTADNALTIANTKDVTASDSLNRVVTTTGISKSGNGYVKLGNGLIIQWGTFSSGSTSQTITLPVAFTSGSSYSVAFGETRGDVPTRNIVISGKTATTFSIIVYDTHTSGLYIAIGY